VLYTENIGVLYIMAIMATGDKKNIYFRITASGKTVRDIF